MAKKTQLLIVGGGVTGAALAFAAARYTSISKITLVEKYPSLGAVNSNATHNSQTLHMGDIETNYSLAKAVQVKQGAQLIANYCKKIATGEQILFEFPKMVVGIGELEVALIEKRFHEFHAHYPTLQLFDKHKIAQIEPAMLLKNGIQRQEPMLACGMEKDYCAANFSRLTHSFITQAQQQPGKEVEIITGTKVKDISRRDGMINAATSQGCIEAELAVVCASGHSLMFAQRLGFGAQFSCLPVAGSFYHTRKLLNGKVYTIQNNKLPFAAIHGDPDLLHPDKTRFGPTALVLPLLERRRIGTLIDFLRVVKIDRNVLAVFRAMLGDKDIRSFIFRNFLYELPYLYRYFFVKEIRKIIPDLKPNDIQYARGVGGLRPQLIDKQKRALAMGEAKIDTGQGLIFNITPSPGASSCLDNACQDIKRLCNQSHYSYFRDQWVDELVPEFNRTIQVA